MLSPYAFLCSAAVVLFPENTRRRYQRLFACIVSRFGLCFLQGKGIHACSVCALRRKQDICAFFWFLDRLFDQFWRVFSSFVSVARSGGSKRVLGGVAGVYLLVCVNAAAAGAPSSRAGMGSAPP